jgi:hypothetical protein
MDEWAKGRDRLEMRSADLKCMLEIESEDQENEQVDVNALDSKEIWADKRFIWILPDSLYLIFKLH